MSRFKDAEKLAADVREGLPDAVTDWLAAARNEMEKLTTAALAGDLSDADFRKLVEETSKRLPELLEEMNHDAIATRLEDAMGAAMGNGIEERIRTAKQPRKRKRPK
jgi:hypothetical protein